MRTFKVARGVVTLAYTPDSTGLWIGDGNARVHRWDLTNDQGKVMFRVQPGNHTSAVHNLSVSADGRFVAASSYNTVALFDVSSALELPLPEGNFTALRSSLSPGGEFLSVTGPSGVAVLWDRPHRVLHTIGEDRGFATNVAFSADSGRLAVSFMEAPGLVVFDTRSAEELVALEVRCIDAMLFSPDGAHLVIAVGNEVALWDTGTWKRSAKFRVSQAFVRRLAIHPNGQLLASAGDVPVLSLWDLTGAQRGKFDWEVGKVQAVAFAPNGMTAAVGGSNGKVAVWDVEEAA